MTFLLHIIIIVFIGLSVSACSLAYDIGKGNIDIRKEVIQ